MNKAESGLQLLSRLDDRPLLNDFDTVLFPNGGPFPKEIIEITGDSNTGKTLLLTEIIAKAILPVRHGGRNVGVILIDTDCHFQIIKLVTALEKFATTQDEDINDIIKESLVNFNILQCHDSMQLNVTIKRLDDILIQNTDVCILAMDNISSFYWSEQNQIKMDTYYRTILRSIQGATWEYKVVFFYTRPGYFFTKNTGDNFTEVPRSGCINYRVKLELAEDEKMDCDGDVKMDAEAVDVKYFQACIETAKDKFVNRYVINEQGFEWNK
ncbi:DNA repair protein XRCC2-like [Ctenocephalides felis]|uniref:DNA repair protein XRCC2-like n=1 Tax=Ctenocephalides felis TaxID=7515 RepID=UPI000E6E3AE3|nr:DNA repair protein XRCC2-like [Ctenocephalides felis]